MVASILDVVVVGAGPTGLLLAGDLAAAGVRAVVLDRAAEPVQTPKGNGVVGRAVLELRRRKLLRGTGLRVVRPPRFRFGPLTLELGLLRSPLHVLPVPQHRLEHLLSQRAVGLGATVLRGHEVTGLEQDGDGVTVQATAGGSPVRLRARYLVGCDGARSFVRKRLGIGFPGVTSADISRLARVTIPADAVTRAGDRVELRGIGPLPTFRPNRTAGGSITIAPVDALDRSAPNDLYIVSTHEPRGDSEPTDELGDEELRASLRRVLGADLPYTTSHAARSVVANSRHAERYRDGRIFLAGDAAHIFSGGGSAINAGLLDAVALGEHLTAVLRGGAPQARLDAYQQQRHPAVLRTLALTRLQVVLESGDETGDALRDVLGELLRDRATARRIATLMEG
ncbi:FAD-dependent monooxygenase [Dactylosporangium aurantiacum]|uniref:FAD-dependent monooxygenase n=1 Tax=Dactylosporangium aurantiacum TaxID=35754 RepID=A0A9Q9MG38_9ACTN